MRTKLMIALLLLVPLVASAAIDTLWSRRWTGAGRHDDAITQIAADPAGFVYTTGIGWDSTTSNFAMVTAKYDSWGGLKWRSTYNAYPFADTFAGILLDAAGDVYVAGTVRFPLRGKQIRTVKYNGTTGAQIWTMGYDALADTSEDMFVTIGYGGPDTARLYICGASYVAPRASTTTPSCATTRRPGPRFGATSTTGPRSTTAMTSRPACASA